MSRKGRWSSVVVLRLAAKATLLALVLLLAACNGINISSVGQSKPSAQSTADMADMSGLGGDTVSFAHIDETPTAGAITVFVTLVDFKIYSTVTTFKVGVPYYFVVTNRGPSVHEFAIFPDKPDGSPLPMDVQYVHRLIEIEQVAPGSTIKLNFVFSAAGRDEIACQMRGHYQAGMRLPIVVNK
jgi:uncharacterized cupredoxin-like copper-binding protein